MADVKKSQTRDSKRQQSVTEAPAEKSRDALLEAGKRLFSKRGYSGTTVKDLADEAGVNVSLVSYYFQGKEGLYRYCIEQFGKGRLTAAQRMLTAPASVEEFKIRLEMFAEGIIESYLEEPELHQMVQRECDLGTPGIEDLYKETFMQIYQTLVAFIESAKERQIVRKEVDAEIASSLLFGSIVHILRMNDLGKKIFGRSIEDEAYRQRVLKQVIPVFFEGLSNSRPAATVERSHEQ